jgi:hypothetical protein
MNAERVEQIAETQRPDHLSRSVDLRPSSNQKPQRHNRR